MADEDARPGVACRFRYATAALHGPWRRSEAEALDDALQAGQAFVRSGRVTLFEFARLETVIFP